MHAYRVTGDQQYLDIAQHAYDYLLKAFWDKQYGGTLLVRGLITGTQWKLANIPTPRLLEFTD